MQTQTEPLTTLTRNGRTFELRQRKPNWAPDWYETTTEPARLVSGADHYTLTMQADARELRPRATPLGRLEAADLHDLRQRLITLDTVEEAVEMSASPLTLRVLRNEREIMESRLRTLETGIATDAPGALEDHVSDAIEAIEALSEKARFLASDVWDAEATDEALSKLGDKVEALSRDIEKAADHLAALLL